MLPVFFFVLAVILFAAFFLIARAGRKLRTQKRITPTAKTAFLEWTEQGIQKSAEIISPFYLGNNPVSNVFLAAAKRQYEACIFSHSDRFAVQALDGAMLKLNGEDIIADFVADGDELEIAGIRFTFRCE